MTTELRSNFEEQQLKNTLERIQTLQTTMHAEQTAIAKHEKEKQEIQADIAAAEHAIAELQESLKELNDILDERTKELDAVKKETSKASKVLDQALKDIASRVSYFCRVH